MLIVRLKTLYEDADKANPCRPAELTSGCCYCLHYLNVTAKASLYLDTDVSHM